MAESESVLLERFAGGDAEAFAQIVGRYAGLVYGTCLRVLADADRAADATQETFFHLTKNAPRIRGSLGAWLHRVAVRQAVDRIRSDSARRKRERAYAAQVDEAQTWHEVSSCVDEALEQLDQRSRELLVHHYLEGRSMTDLAEEMGVSRPTVSRQIDSGLARVRAHLKRQGVLVTAAGLSTLLAENVAQSAPEIVLRQLGKMTLLAAQAAGTAGSGASSAAILTGGVLAAANTKLITAAVAVIVVAISVVAYKGFSSRPTTSASPALAAREDRSSDGKATPTGSQGPVAAVESQSPELPPSPKAAAPESKPATPFFPVREVAESEVAAPGESAASGADSGPDLSSPEATVRSFTKAFISGNAEAVMACMLPGGTDHEDVQELLAAGPDDPQLRDKYQFRLLLQSLDPDAEMPIHSTEQTERGTSVSWQVIFKKDLAMAGHMFHAGDTFELDATLRKSGDSWLIDGI